MADPIYSRRMGDRKDGRQLRSISVSQKLIPYFEKARSAAAISYTDSVEITELEKYIRKKRSEDCADLSILHVFIAAYVRTVSVCPGINRFISGQRVYARHKVVVITPVKRPASQESSDVEVKIPLSPSDTMSDIYRKFNDKTMRIKTGDGELGIETLMSPITRIPGSAAKLAMWFFNIADYFGWLPSNFQELSPYHGSVMITDLAAQGVKPVAYSLNDFGNLSLKISFGAKRKTVELVEKDQAPKAVLQQYVDYSINLDGRICDQNYYTSAFKYFKHYLRHPELLDKAPESIAEDIF